MIIYGFAVILIMIFRPGGLLGTSELRIGQIVANLFNRRKEVAK